MDNTNSPDKKTEVFAPTGNSPLPPFAANPTPPEGAAEPTSSQDAAAPQGDLQAGPPPHISPDMASTPSGSVSQHAISGSAPKVVPAETRGEGRSEGGIVLINEAPADEEVVPGPAADIAALIRDQLDILTQRIFYDSQELMRPSALAPDPVTIRTILVTLASALEHNDNVTFLCSFSRTNLTISPQINDQVIPYHSGTQLSAMIDGILRDAVSQAFKDDKAKRDAALEVLEQMAGPAYKHLQRQPTYLEKPLAPRV